MGTTWQVQWFGEPTRELVRNAIQEELDLVIRQMSHWSPESDLSRLRYAPVGEWTTIPTEFCTVLELALRISEETGGAYDPTIGALVANWGFGPDPVTALPTLDSLAQIKCGWRDVELDACRYRLRHQGDLSLDLSAIAKGFAVDQVGRALNQLGIESQLVEIGGEVRAWGIRADRQPWWVELEPPGDVPFPAIRVALSDWSIATSGDYRQCRSIDGLEWSHTIDPRTRRTVTHRLAAVTVIHQDCMAADAYSTALMVMGVQEGLDFADGHGLAALMTERTPGGLVIHISSAAKQML